jgi:hypothetical protein
MIAKHAKLITVLFFAVMILVLAYLVMAATSCAPVQATVPPTQTVRAMPTEIIEDGTISHPYHVDPCPCAVPVDTWNVLTVHGQERWVLNWIYDVHGGASAALHPGDYISYQGNEYQIAGVDRAHLRMSAVIVGN